MTFPPPRPHPIAWALVALVAAAAWALDAWLLCVALGVPIQARGSLCMGIALVPVAFMAQGTTTRAGAAAHAALALALGAFLALVGVYFVDIMLTP